MHKWEYERRFFLQLPHAIDLNALGQTGWELIAIISGAEKGKEGYYLFLKRAISN
jgi:hypothetical protein